MDNWSWDKQCSVEFTRKLLKVVGKENCDLKFILMLLLNLTVSDLSWSNFLELAYYVEINQHLTCIAHYELSVILSYLLFYLKSYYYLFKNFK